MNTALSRFQVIQGTPPSAPGKCAICGTTAGPFIDFGLELDFYGVVYICIDNCFNELATLFEYCSPNEKKHMEEQYAELKSNYDNLINYNEELSNAVDALSRLRSDDSSIVPGQLALDFTESKESEVPSGDTGQDDGSVSTGHKKTTRRKTRSTQQTDEQGSSSVHSDDSIDSILTDTI